MMLGTVTKWFSDRGYGFIRGKDKKEYFVHFTELEVNPDQETGRRDLSIGFLVEFSPSENEKGFIAKSVRYSE